MNSAVRMPQEEILSKKKNAPRKVKYRHKHPQKIHVWAGISKRFHTTHDFRRYHDSTEIW